MTRRFAFLLALLLVSAAANGAEPWFGMTVRPVQDAKGKRALHVANVIHAGPADRAGLRPGDLVTMIGSVPVGFSDNVELLTFLRQRKPGQRLTLTVSRAGRMSTFVIIVGTLPDSQRGAWDRAIARARESGSRH